MRAEEDVRKEDCLRPVENASAMMRLVLEFLQLFVTETCARRIVAVILLIAGVHDKRVVELTSFSARTVWSARKGVEKGVDVDRLLLVGKGRGAKGKLAGIEEDIMKELDSRNHVSRQQIVDMVQEKVGISISVATAGRFLKKNGYRRLMSGSLPAKADTENQATFFETILEPLMDKAKAGKLNLLFLDASHFVIGCDFTGRIWCKVRRLLRTSSGRKRYNVLGALDHVSKVVHTVTNDAYITATEVCGMLRRLRESCGPGPPSR